jgi:hypothetical protein
MRKRLWDLRPLVADGLLEDRADSQGGLKNGPAV